MLWGRGRGQRCRIRYKNTVYERLRSNIKFINTKKSHPVRQSQQCQCSIQKLTSTEYYKASNRFLSVKNVTWITWFRRLTIRPQGQSSWERCRMIRGRGRKFCPLGHVDGLEAKVLNKGLFRLNSQMAFPISGLLQLSRDIQPLFRMKGSKHIVQNIFDLSGLRRRHRAHDHLIPSSHFL